MSNAWFQFKQFRIGQEACAMKVSTDACIQGAWTPIPSTARRALDVGTGTGLLALMLAQRSQNLQIDAIELDGSAAAQAMQNVRCSPFAGRVGVLEEDARTYTEPCRYDLIICNPPFFSDSLLGPHQERNQARHNITLQQLDLLRLVNTNLCPEGIVSVMWPVAGSLSWEALVQREGYHCCARLTVKDKEYSRPTRVIACHSRSKPAACNEELLIIRQADGSYTPYFASLLAPFYLRL